MHRARAIGPIKLKAKRRCSDCGAEVKSPTLTAMPRRAKNVRKVLFRTVFCLGMVLCLILAGRVIYPAAATATGEGRGPESKFERFVRRMTGHLHHFVRRVKSEWQDRGLGEQQRQDD